MGDFRSLDLHTLASVKADRGPHVTPPRQYELEYDIGIDGLFVAVSGLGLILQWTSLSLKHYRGFFASAARAPQRGGICYTNCKKKKKGVLQESPNTADVFPQQWSNPQLL